jgi:hypothetical protein
MKKLYGVCDDGGEVYAVYSSPDECAGLETVELVKNPTWRMSDWTDRKTGDGYIRVERLAVLFDELCKNTGVQKQVLAKQCGKTNVTFSRYCSGETPVPELVWREVERINRNIKGK